MNDPSRFDIPRSAHASPAARVPAITIGPADSAAFWMKTVGPCAMTVWHNPTRHNGYIDVCADALFARPPAGPPMMVRIAIPAGQKCQIPSAFDRGIHQTSNGFVTGGLAPAWRCEGAFPVHEGLVDTSHEPYDGNEAA
jgi:hypothetical protein